MTLAMKRLKNLGWLALVFLVAIMLYPMSLNVASLHSDLVRVDSKILQTKREISFLQAELRTRANLQQLNEWNEVLYGYKSPTAEQFADGESALAGTGGDAPSIKPVMVAVSSGGVAPTGVIGAPRNDVDENAKPAEKPTVTLAQNDISKDEKSAAKEGAVQKQRVADMGKKLLSDDFLKQVEARAKKEAKNR